MEIIEMDFSDVALVDIPPSVARDDLERRLPRGSRFADLTGRQYDRVRVVGFAGYLGRYAAWLCQCECGEFCIKRTNILNSVNTGCGCRHDGTRVNNELYVIWSGMKARCNNPSNSSYSRYGGRGIRVCRRWRESVSAFLSDMGPRPSDQHSIDRIDNDGDYEPGNCRWATRTEQSLNSSSCTPIAVGDNTMTIRQWAAEVGVSRQRLSQRIQKCIELGASISQAITTPRGERMPCTRDRIN